MPTTGITIVVPAYNEERYLPTSLAAINQARICLEEKLAISSEVVVVNNASTDKTAEVARSLGASIIDHYQRNIASVRNAGIGAANYPLVVCIDADSILPNDGLLQIWQLMSSGDYIGGALEVKFDAKNWFIGRLARGFQHLVYLVSGIYGGMFFFWKDEALAMGGFPEKHLVAEDAAFAIALKRHGRKRGKKFAMLKSVEVITADRKDNDLKTIITVLIQATKSFLGVRTTQDDLAYWYRPKR